MEELLDKLEILSLNIWQANEIASVLYDYTTIFNCNDTDKISALAVEVNSLASDLKKSIDEALKKAYEVNNETK